MQSYFLLLLIFAVSAAHAKIVFLNGTEVLDDHVRSNNAYFSVFNARNISNHSGTTSSPVTISSHRKNDEEEVSVDVSEPEEVHDDIYSTGMATRDTTVLSSLRGLWSNITPILTILSTLLGIFLMFVIIESPLSPLPVPPLPYPPIGPYPPTNLYPFGIPPSRQHYGVRYAAPSVVHASYRIPRQMQLMNGIMNEAIENWFEKVVASDNTKSESSPTAAVKSLWTPDVFLKSMNAFLTNIGWLPEERSKLSSAMNHNSSTAVERNNVTKDTDND